MLSLTKRKMLEHDPCSFDILDVPVLDVKSAQEIAPECPPSCFKTKNCLIEAKLDLSDQGTPKTILHTFSEKKRQRDLRFSRERQELPNILFNIRISTIRFLDSHHREKEKRIILGEMERPVRRKLCRFLKKELELKEREEKIAFGQFIAFQEKTRREGPDHVPEEELLDATAVDSICSEEIVDFRCTNREEYPPYSLEYTVTSIANNIKDVCWKQGRNAEELAAVRDEIKLLSEELKELNSQERQRKYIELMTLTILAGFVLGLAVFVLR